MCSHTDTHSVKLANKFKVSQTFTYSKALCTLSKCLNHINQFSQPIIIVVHPFPGPSKSSA